MIRYAHNMPPQYTEELEYAAHLKQELISVVLYSLRLLQLVWSAVGEGVGVCIPDQGFWYGFAAQANQTSHSAEIIELVAKLSADNEVVISSLNDYSKSLCRSNTQVHSNLLP